MIIGVGNLGPTCWKKVVCRNGVDMSVTIAIGMVADTSHMVIVVAGGPVLLVYDFEDETCESELNPHTTAAIFNGVEEVGSEFQFDKSTEEEGYELISMKLEK
jgi:hypothetical protein